MIALVAIRGKSSLIALWIFTAYLLAALSEASAYWADPERPPGMLASDCLGNFYVVAGGWLVVEKTSPQGKDLGEFCKALHADYMVFDKNGDFYLLSGEKIMKYTGSGEKIWEFAMEQEQPPRTTLELRGPVTPETPKVKLRKPYALAIDSHGIVYVSCLEVNTIDRIDGSGKYLGVFATLPDARPKGMAFDVDDNLYVVNSASKTIEKISPKGVDLGVFIGAGLQEPGEIVLDKQGNLYVKENVRNKGDRVKKFSPTGKEIGLIVPKGISESRGLVLDREGNVYIASFWDGKVLKYSPEGKELGVFVTDGQDCHAW